MPIKGNVLFFQGTEVFEPCFDLGQGFQSLEDEDLEVTCIVIIWLFLFLEDFQRSRRKVSFWKFSLDSPHCRGREFGREHHLCRRKCSESPKEEPSEISK